MLYEALAHATVALGVSPQIGLPHFEQEELVLVLAADFAEDVHTLVAGVGTATIAENKGCGGTRAKITVRLLHFAAFRLLEFLLLRHPLLLLAYALVVWRTAFKTTNIVACFAGDAIGAGICAAVATYRSPRARGPVLKA